VSPEVRADCRYLGKLVLVQLAAMALVLLIFGCGWIPEPAPYPCAGCDTVRIEGQRWCLTSVTCLLCGRHWERENLSEVWR